MLSCVKGSARLFTRHIIINANLAHLLPKEETQLLLATRI